MMPGETKYQEFYKDQLLQTLHRFGYEPGDLQWKWRTRKGLPFDMAEIDAALLDAFVNMGGATAWTGDGSSCAAQIVQNIMEERDSLREERDALLVELSQKPSEPARWEYMDFQFNSHPSIPETLEQLNRLGQEGWELCDMIDAGPQVRPLVVLLFKRRLCAQTNK
jgi:hypothetical protein